VKADDAFGNVWRARPYNYEYQRGRLDKVVDRHEWPMTTPQTVNAFNLPLHIALTFPAAILVPPYFDGQAPAAANYGSIGSTIGHEISHTFDTEGSKIDAQGRLRNWWTASDLAHFRNASAGLAKQYDEYRPFPDLTVNGKQTLAENVADVAGLSAAFDGYQASLRGETAPVQDGFTGDQQFFIAFAQRWATKMRPASLRAQVMTGIHAPGQYRALEVRNIDAWYDAFDVKPADGLYLAPDARVRIW
jgi:endothelin-converting enzyme/putative endopeptidase